MSDPQLEHHLVLAGCETESSSCAPLRLDHNTVAIAHGNGVRIISTKSPQDGPPDAEKFLEIPEANRGVSSIAVCAKNNLLAVAVRGQQPAIHIFMLPTLARVTCLTGNAQIEYSCMDVSRDGTLLVAIGGRLGRVVDLFDLSSMSLVNVDLIIGAPEVCHDVRFAPADRFLFASWGIGGLFFWHIELVHNVYRLRWRRAMTQYESPDELEREREQTKLAESVSLSIEHDTSAPRQRLDPDEPNEVTLKDIEQVTAPMVRETIPGRGPVAFIWMSDQSACSAMQDGSICRFDPDEGHMITLHSVPKLGTAEGQSSNTSSSTSTQVVDDITKLIPPVSPRHATALLATTQHLIVSTKDGHVLWLMLPRLKIATHFTLPQAETGEACCFLVPGEHMRSGLAFTNQGRLVSFDTLPPAAFDDVHFSAAQPDATVAPSLTVEHSDPPNVSWEQVRGPSANRILATATAYAQPMCPTSAVHSIGDDRHVRTYDAATGKLLASCNEPLGELSTCASVANVNIIAVGNMLGEVHFLVLQPTNRRGDEECVLVRVSTLRLHQSAVTHLTLSSNNLLASCGHGDADVSIVNLSNLTSPRLIAFASGTNPVTSVNWVNKGTCLLISAFETSGLLRVDTSKIVSDAATVQELSMEQASTLTSEPSSILTIEAKDNKSVCIATFGSSPEVAILGLNTETEQYDSIGSLVCPSAKGVVCSAFHPSDMLVATGSTSGSVCVWRLKLNSAEGSIEAEILHRVHIASSPIVTLSFSADAKYIAYAAAADAGLNVSKLVGISGVVKVPASKQNSFSPSEQIKAGIMELTEIQKHKHAQQLQKEAEFTTTKEKRRIQLQRVRERLDKLVANNENADELERLDRNEFTIDLEGKAEMQQDAKTRVEQKEQEIRKIDGDCQQVIDKIRAEAWESTSVKGCNLFALKALTRISNFPMSKEKKQDVLRAEQMIRLRRVELREQRAFGHGPTMNKYLKVSFREETDWIVNFGAQLPNLDRLFSDDGSAGEKSTKEGDDKKEGEKMGDGAAGASGGGDGTGGAAGNDSKQGGTKPESAGQGTGGASAGLEADDDDEEHQLENVVAMLYHPAALRTPVQKRTQISLIQQICRDMRAKFNERFSALKRLKEDETDRIAEKNERVKEILHDLKNDDEVFVPTWQPSEQPETLVVVEADEVGIERYISKAEQERLAVEAEEQRKRDAANAKDSKGERALLDMMNGTLEQKKDNTMTMELVRPDWMNEVEPEEMSDEQRVEYEAFVAQEKALEVERDKHRKTLELELKKLRVEIGDIIAHFDNRVEALFQVKIKVLREIKIQELYISRLALSAMQTENARQDILQLKNMLGGLETDKIEKYKVLRQFKTMCDVVTGDLKQLQEEDRMLERGFKASMNESCPEVLDIDTMKVLQQLFKQRSGKPKPHFFDGSGARGSFSLVRRSSINRRKSRGNSLVRLSLQGHGGMQPPTQQYPGGQRGAHPGRQLVREGTLSSNISGKTGVIQVHDSPNSTDTSQAMESGEADLDPLGNIGMETSEERERREHTIAMAPLDLETDCPEGFLIEKEEWDRLQALRHEKIVSELRVRKQAGEAVVLGRRLHDLQEAYKTVHDQIKNVTKSIQHLQDTIANNTINTEIVVRLKQGQDEVKPEPVVTNYGDCSLVHRSVIEAENVEICKLGEAKVGTLNKMKEFRKSINYMQWEHQFMAFQAHDLEEHYTDLHMLRVTRSLQEFIKGGSTQGHNKIKVAHAEAKYEHMKRAHATKLEKLERSIDTIDQQAAKKELENDKLSQHLDQLHTIVSLRESVQNTRSTFDSNDTGAENAKESTMNSIITKRRLKDLAKAQAEELEFLCKELDRVRRRTYPCFTRPDSQGGAQYQQYAPDDNGADGEFEFR